MNDYKTKLQHFAETVQCQSQVQCKLSGVGCQTNLDNCKTSIVPGKKYDKVNVGGSGRYMVDKFTCEIFGIKGYGQIHKGHRYGTLDTIVSWWWGGYHPTVGAWPVGAADSLTNCATEDASHTALRESREAAYQGAA